MKIKYPKLTIDAVSVDSKALTFSVVLVDARGLEKQLYTQMLVDESEQIDANSFCLMMSQMRTAIEVNQP